jgi:hypothetical protein
MSLRDQPYLPLYVQDFLTDEKLIECSASTHGVYIRLMCIMHKSDDYGCILLKQKDKQSDKQEDKQNNKQNESMVESFALKLSKQMPFSLKIITDALNELLEEKVLLIDGDKLSQKRMVKDGTLSSKRSKSAIKGGGNPNFVKINLQTNTQTNAEIEIEYEISNNIDSLKSENFENFQTFNFEETKKILTENSQIWHEQIRMADTRINSELQLNELIIKFLLKQNSTGSYFPTSIDNVRRHFANTLPKMEIECEKGASQILRLSEVY